ncbi:MAG: SDR family oxidoreductase [Ignavibacteriales bacterium]|jgi:NAD(P)-dependent dehydrogenase (short-subunit alcohol dehydrogenase family)|nr:MAG: SDR family oxidoreductase [Ignavibacterium sp.]MCO6446675.1 SDR family oxidoreductase [Ignavibacterium album]MCZ2269421.1 SDR family oxidoreductase [Ignavibacteriales bacterium]MDX9711012.1 SDR family oxidoreductase [Ignavibacteriaceae bacterium]GIK21010.1 MAG: short-chain dehydrogenase [Ignavibacteriota bacterium]
MKKSDKQELYALILGASSGFGEATAVKLAKDGFNILGVHLDRQATMHNVERIIKEIESAGVEAKFFNANAADEVKRNGIINEIKTLLNGKPLIKVIMHSLAFGTLKPFIPANNEQAITKAQLEMTLDVMAHSLVYWVQDVVSNNLLAKGARIFAMTSSGGHSIIPFYGAVSAAKAALESHIRQLSVELGEKFGASANSIMAGVTDTPALRKIPGNTELIDIAERKNPHGRLTTPEDIAKVISLLCKDGGEWVSGGLIHADGGEDIVNYVGQKKSRQI